MIRYWNRSNQIKNDRNDTYEKEREMKVISYASWNVKRGGERGRFDTHIVIDD